MPGIGHERFQVDDIAAVHDHLVALRATFRIRPSPFPVPGIPFPHLADPEGHLVELLGPRSFD